MAKSKTKKIKEVDLLKVDLEKIKIPFDLFTGLSLIVDELKVNTFTYSHLTPNDRSPMLTFESKDKGQKINVNIEKENLLVRQYEINGLERKLLVIYVVKPTERAFKLI